LDRNCVEENENEGIVMNNWLENGKLRWEWESNEVALPVNGEGIGMAE
jgi:hypothetical protein